MFKVKLYFIKSFNLLVFDDVSGFMIYCYVLGDEVEMKR